MKRHAPQFCFRKFSQVVLNLLIIACCFMVADFGRCAAAEVPAPLQWNTFLGGALNPPVSGALEDSGTAIAIDGSGNIYVSGVSAVSWGTPVNPHSSPEESYDIFVAKLNNSGVLQWNTFLGGVSDTDSYGNDFAHGIAVDKNGNVYVSGESNTSWGIPVHAFAGGAGDAFVAKLDSSGNLQWNTFMGGAGSDPLGHIDDAAYDILLDVSGNVYVAGISFASWGAPLNAFSDGRSDAFVAKFNNSGVLQWNTFLGGTVYDPNSGYGDAASGIELDGSDNIYIAGASFGTWGSPINPFAGGRDIFVVKLNSDGAFQWNTFMGSSVDDDDGFDIALDGMTNVYVTGVSWDTWGSPVAPYPSGALAATIVAKLNGSGVMQWHTFLGGAGYQQGSALALDEENNIYLTGDSETTWDLPQEILPGGENIFIARLNNDGSLLWNSFLGGPDHDIGYSIALAGDSLYITGESSANWGSPIDAFEGSSDGFVARLSKIPDLNLTLIVNGSGSVTSSPAGISCPYDCDQSYAYGTDVALTAVPASGFVFIGWTGECSGSVPECTITMDRERNVTAEFYPFPWLLFLPAIMNNSQTIR